MKQVTGFVTTDDKFFLAEEEDNARAHQAELNFRRWCGDHICRGGEWSYDMIAREILDHWNVTPRGLAIQPVPERFFSFEYEVWQESCMLGSFKGTQAKALQQAKDLAGNACLQRGKCRIFEVVRVLVPEGKN